MLQAKALAAAVGYSSAGMHLDYHALGYHAAVGYHALGYHAAVGCHALGYHAAVGYSSAWGAP